MALSRMNRSLRHSAGLWLLAALGACSSSGNGPDSGNVGGQSASTAKGNGTNAVSTGGALTTADSGGATSISSSSVAAGGNDASSNGGTNSIGSNQGSGGTHANSAATTNGNASSGNASGGASNPRSSAGAAGTQRNASGGARASGGNATATTGGSKASAGAATGGRASGNGGVAAGGTGKGGASNTNTGGSVSHAGASACGDGAAPVVPEGYALVWSDEFDADGAPNSANWGFETGFVRNNEAQWYQPDNAFVEGGCLVIEGRRERKTNPNYKAGSSDWKTSRQYAEYTSSSLRTMGKHSWRYGRLEMRGRIKTQVGLWPAWWTLGVAKEWPSCGEIDIMEFYAGSVRANIACGTGTQWQAKWDGAAWQVSTFEDKNWQDSFHTWRMDWDDTKIDLLLDDKLVNTAKLADMLNADGSSPFKQEHYMIVNLAIGGDNGGDPAKTAFPTRYEVDYVRVFQKQ